MGTVRFGNDQIAKIMGYGYYQLGNVTISRVYYVEGLGHKLFSVGQFCDTDLEVAFRKHTCHIRDLEGVDLLKGSRGSNLYTLSLENMMSTSPICLLSNASKTKSWLWHRRLSHLNFNYITQLAKQGMLLNPPPSVVSLVPIIAAQRPGVKESLKTPYFHDDPLYETLHEDPTSQGSSSNVRPSHTQLDLLDKWTKNHPLENVIRDPSRTVSTRKQLKIDAMWCYFDAFLTSIELKNFKEEMLESSWIKAMQEEIHEFERLQVWELVPYPDFVMLIKLKWIYKVKKDKLGGILNNKDRLVAIRGTVCTCCQNRGHSVWKSVRYGVSNGLDTAYWGFLGVGTTFDIFQNIHILYLEYGVLSLFGYGVLSFIHCGLCHLGVEESLREQDSNKGKGKEVVGPSVNLTE
ncbi:retrovirus-related pol polyprotein from transposon TNT 1-94 [Tanacetum coccineum]